VTQDRAKTQDPSARKGESGLPIPRTPFRLEGDPTGVGTLGRYRFVEEIGIGGMASVHLARMDGPGGFQKWVAIKRIHPHLIADETFIQMFLDEARIAGRISHPNVATVFELGKHGTTYWIAMEYLHGEPLREVMRRTGELGGPIPPEIAARIVADAAEGLHSAHELLGKNGEKLHLIHRDVTPHNLFVTYEGTTKVVDFGIAKCNSRMSSTRAGTLKGKLAYMSPEQVQGEAIDRRTDIFALGVVLWELTTGKRLFRVDSDLGTLARVRECDIPRPTRIVRDYPIDLENIVMKALSKNRAERFSTAREFSRALQSLLMRRGLFIASDEVAGYIRFIFRERIRRREAYLRWAGNLTQAVQPERPFETRRSLAASATPSFHTYVSDTHAAVGGIRTLPRPAAGSPVASQPSLAPTVVRPAAGDAGDEADTIIVRRATEEHSPFPLVAAGVALPVRAVAPSSPAGAPSSRPVAHSPRRRLPQNPTRRNATPGAVPVWAAAAISGALALLPASGVFFAVSRALRPSAKIATDHASSKLPSPAAHPSALSLDGGATLAGSPASMVEAGCTPLFCTP